MVKISATQICNAKFQDVLINRYSNSPQTLAAVGTEAPQFICNAKQRKAFLHSSFFATQATQSNAKMKVCIATSKPYIRRHPDYVAMQAMQNRVKLVECGLGSKNRYKHPNSTLILPLIHIIYMSGDFALLALQNRKTE